MDFTTNHHSCNLPLFHPSFGFRFTHVLVLLSRSVHPAPTYASKNLSRCLLWWCHQMWNACPDSRWNVKAVGAMWKPLLGGYVLAQTEIFNLLTNEKAHCGTHICLSQHFSGTPEKFHLSPTKHVHDSENTCFAIIIVSKRFPGNVWGIAHAQTQWLTRVCWLPVSVFP